jgi:exosortase
LNAEQKIAIDRPTGSTSFLHKAHWVTANWAFCLQATILLTLTGILYFSILKHLVQNWSQDSNYSHAFFVPAFAAFLVWERRRKWAASVIRPRYSGLALIFGAMALLLIGILGAEVFLSRVSFLFLLLGFLVYFAGWQTTRALAAPWLVLFLMIPLPVIIFNEIAFPLQMLASRLAGSTMDLMRLPVVREGNIIVLPSITLDVAEACSGIRSLMSLVTLAIFYGLIVERRVWMRCLLVFAAIPIAVAANALRIVGAAFLAEHAGAQYAEGFFHVFSGWLIFVVTVLMLVGLHEVSSRLAHRKTAT